MPRSVLCCVLPLTQGTPGQVLRFECAAGNPPFIRYQHFNGATRARALELCGRLGASFTGLASSWAPFIAAAAGLLKPGGRLAFVVPAEIGHAPCYARTARMH
jgi:adenine-specific DNA-methyltransferase